MSTIAENVERGAKLLDEKMPGWEKKVGPSITDGYFDMTSWDNCMAGTLEMVRYVDDEWTPDGLDVHIQLNGTKLTTIIEAVKYGFFYHGPDRCGWEELDAEWRKQVKKRGVNVPKKESQDG